MIVTWAASSASSRSGLPGWPLLLFGLFMLLGAMTFLVAMVWPQWLPDRRLAERDREAERQAEAANQLAVDKAKRFIAPGPTLVRSAGSHQCPEREHQALRAYIKDQERRGTDG